MTYMRLLQPLLLFIYYCSNRRSYFSVNNITLHDSLNIIKISMNYEIINIIYLHCSTIWIIDNKLFLLLSLFFSLI